MACVIVIVCFVTGCDQITGPSKSVREQANEWTPETVRQFVKAQGAIPSDDHWHSIEAAYWQGVKDQAISNDRGKPIVIAERRDGKLLIYKPVESYPLNIIEAEVEAESLVAGLDKVLPKKK